MHKVMEHAVILAKYFSIFSYEIYEAVLWQFKRVLVVRLTVANSLLDFVNNLCEISCFS